MLRELADTSVERVPISIRIHPAMKKYLDDLVKELGCHKYYVLESLVLAMMAHNDHTKLLPKSLINKFLATKKTPAYLRAQ